MKKILSTLIFSLLLIANSALAFEIDYLKGGKSEELLQKVGYRILNANKIPYRTNFVLAQKKQINASTSCRNKTIVLYDTTLRYLTTEDELAAILAHEISHLVDLNQGAFNGQFACFTQSFAPKKYELKADKRAVDYLVNAGYHPVAEIVALNKITDQPRYDWNLSHPLGSKRMASVYEYIYSKYPQYLVENPYKDNVVYQNFLLTSRENRKKLQDKVKTNSNRQINYL